MTNTNQETFHNFADEISEMFKIDQEAVLDPEIWERFQKDPDGQLKHTARMKQIIKEIGWPSFSKIGRDVAGKAWFLVQHSDQDVEFQKEVLDILKNLPDSEVSKYNVAMLEDRVRKNEGRPQLYGSQWKVKNGVQVPYEIEDPEHVEERRASMGMETMSESKRHLEEWSKMATELRDKKHKESS